MFTQDEIEKVMIQARVSRLCPTIDFDWFDTIVEAAEEVGVLGHEIEIDTLGESGGDFRLLLIINGLRLGSQRLTFEKEWSEQYVQEPVQDSVQRLLGIAMREIKQIETTRDTWYAARRTGI